MAETAFPPCRVSACHEQAVAFADACWEHVDRDRYLKELPASLKKQSAGAVLRLNLKKVLCANLDLSHFDLTGSSFSQAILSNALFIGATLSQSDMIGARFHACDFVGADLRGANLTRASLDRCSFSFADLRGAWLVETHWKESDLTGGILYDSVIWNAELAGAKQVKKKNFHDPDAGPRYLERCRISEANPLVALESYRTLKHHFYHNGLYEDGSWAAYRELVMERKGFYEKGDLRFFPSFAMDLVSGYTQKPNRVILAAFAVVLAFGLAYYGLNAAQPSAHPNAGPIGFLDSVYFSFITFTTVGYGDFAPRPVPFFRILACIEAFSGPFMAGLYIFTLTRRYSAG